MTKSYHHLTNEERDWIGQMKAQGKSIRDIARWLGRNPSSISREVQRNQSEVCGTVGYFPSVAMGLATHRRSHTHQRKRLKDEMIVAYVKEKLRQRWSPELIAGRLPVEMPGITISHEAIYQWIYTEGKVYITSLARHRRIRRRRGYTSKPQKHRIPARVSIDERPRSIEARDEVGHWEVDTVGVDHDRPTLQVLTERKTRYTKVRKLKTNAAEVAKKTIVASLITTPQHLVKTFTYDNGSENSGHVWVNYKLGTRSYFCHPYHSWERGSVENIIGLIRRIYPKKTHFGTITPGQVKKLQHWLNSRPKKCLGFRTPFEAYQQEKCCT